MSEEIGREEEDDREFEAGIERLVCEAIDAEGKGAAYDCSEVALEHPSACFPFYGTEEDFPGQVEPGEILKLYPDGRREIVDFDREGNEVLVRKL